jgi:hypothetical protein
MMIGKLISGWGITIYSNNLYTNNTFKNMFNTVHTATDLDQTNNDFNSTKYDTVRVALSDEVIEILKWAKHKMKEESELQTLAEQFPVLEEALKDLEVIKILVAGKKSS